MICCRELASTVEVEVCLLSMLIDCVVTTTAVVDKTVNVTRDVEVVTILSNLVDVVVVVFKVELLRTTVSTGVVVLNDEVSLIPPSTATTEYGRLRSRARGSSRSWSGRAEETSERSNRTSIVESGVRRILEAKCVCSFRNALAE